MHYAVFRSCESSQPAAFAPKQSRLDAFIRKAVSPQQSNKITSLILNVIVGDLGPINLIEGKHFQALIGYLAPGYTLPSRQTFTRKIEKKEKACKEKIKTKLAAQKHLAITTDIWTSLRMQSYITVTAHHLSTSDKTTMQNYVLDTRQVMEGHTGNNVVQWIEEILSEYSVPPEKIVGLVTDNGSNMVVAGSSLGIKYGWNHIRCSAHTLQLCIKDALGSSAAIMNAIGAARHLVSYFRQSSKAMAALCTAQQNQTQTTSDKTTNLLLDVSTRWNSTYAMIKRLCQLQWVVRQVISDSSLTRGRASHLKLRDNQWIILQQLLVDLEPFKIATDFLEGDSYVTIAGVMPLIKGLIVKFAENPQNSAQDSVLLPCIVNFRQKIVSSLQERFKPVVSGDSDDEPNYSITVYDKATWLHPSYKACYFKKVHGFQVKAAIEAEMQDTNSSPIVQVSSESESESADRSVMTNLLSLGVETDTASNLEEYVDKASEEIALYLKAKTLSKSSQLLEWWHEKRNDCPLLYNLGLRYLCIPATSASSERSFSSAGLTVSALRSRLTGSHVGALNILHCNQGFLNSL